MRTALIAIQMRCPEENMTMRPFSWHLIVRITIATNNSAFYYITVAIIISTNPLHTSNGISNRIAEVLCLHNTIECFLFPKSFFELAFIISSAYFCMVFEFRTPANFFMFRISMRFPVSCKLLAC